MCGVDIRITYAFAELIESKPWSDNGGNTLTCYHNISADDPDGPNPKTIIA